MSLSYVTVIYLVMGLSIALLIMAIVADFILYENNKEIKLEQRSIVATGSMFMFYAVYMLFIKFGWGQVHVDNPMLGNIMLTLGAAMVPTGSLFNVLGRLDLQNNWANHIRIYKDHKMVEQGIYKVVRHPLYASLMLMFFGGAIAYTNPVCALLNIGVFIPSMYYRARLEEKILLKEFKEYRNYMEKTGMFFPKIR